MTGLSDGTPTTPAMEIEWSDLNVILAVCRTGSLSGAARTLGLNHSTVFRKINGIEKKTGVRFFERLSHGYVMTDAGETTMRFAERVENEVHALGREILGRDMRLQGKIRVTAPEGIASILLPSALATFCSRNPDISIDLVGTSTALDLSRREADVAVRVTDKPPDTSLGRRICDFRFCVYAAPEYLEKHNARILEEHDWLMTIAEIDWLIPLIWKNRALANRSIVFASSLTSAVVSAAKARMGVVLLPCFYGDMQRELVRVTDPPESLTMQLWILTHPDLRYTARVKALMAHLDDSLGKQKELIEGSSRTGHPSVKLKVPF